MIHMAAVWHSAVWQVLIAKTLELAPMTPSALPHQISFLGDTLQYERRYSLCICLVALARLDQALMVLQDENDEANATHVIR